MSFIDCLNGNEKKTLHDVTFRTVTAEAFFPSPAPIPEGVLYSTGTVTESIPNGTANQILKIDPVSGNPEWADETSIPHPEGLIYSNGTNETSITTGTNGQILAVSAGVPTWVNQASIPQPEGLIYSNGTTESSISTGTNGQILSVVAGIPTWADSSVDFPLTSITVNFIDSQGGQNMYLSVPLLFQRIGNLVTVKFNRSGSYTTIATLTNNNSYLITSAPVPAQFRPATTQLCAPFAFGHNNTWNDNSGFFWIDGSGNISMRSSANVGYGFNYGGQVLNWIDQTFTYLLTLSP